MEVNQEFFRMCANTAVLCHESKQGLSFFTSLLTQERMKGYRQKEKKNNSGGLSLITHTNFHGNICQLIH